MRKETSQSKNRGLLQSSGCQLAVLTFVHFTVDFYGGLTVPIPEPTLTGHLAVTLPRVALLVGGCALLTNVIQPVSQWLLPRRGAPLLLLAAPLMAACVALIGLSSEYWIAATLLIVGAVGIGIVHPEGALAAYSVAGTRRGLGMGIFMSGGYLGFSLGSLVAGLWTEYRDQGLDNFWLLVLPAVLAAGLVWVTRLHRIEGHMAEDAAAEGDGIPVWPVLALTVAIAVNICVLVRFLPILLVRTFPELDAQGWGGTAVFVMGFSAVAGMCLWGRLSVRFGLGRTIAVVMLAGLPFLWLLLHVRVISMTPVWGAGVGFTMSAMFPLCVVLVRQAHGLPQRLRMGLAIGGAWGTGELVFVLGGRYVGRFPEGAVRPVASVLNLCWLLAVLTIVMALCVAGMERRGRGNEIDPRGSM